jgi:hypothetical protein
MSVTFSDVNDPLTHDENSLQVTGKGANYNNANAAAILQIMGLYDWENPTLYGEMSGFEFRKALLVGISNIEIMIYISDGFETGGFWMASGDWRISEKLGHYSKIRARLMYMFEQFADSKEIRWG